MKLNKLYKHSDKEVFLEYISKLQNHMLKSGLGVINEAKITITIDDDNKVDVEKSVAEPQIVHHHHGGGIPEETKIKFLDGAKKIGEFSDSEWVEQLLRGMEQAGVQGARARFNDIKESDSPVTRAEIKQLIDLLVDVIKGS